jgi:hypothetical protein
MQNVDASGATGPAFHVIARLSLDIAIWPTSEKLHRDHGRCAYRAAPPSPAKEEWCFLNQAAAAAPCHSCAPCVACGLPSIYLDENTAGGEVAIAKLPSRYGKSLQPRASIEHLKGHPNAFIQKTDQPYRQIEASSHLVQRPVMSSTRTKFSELKYAD